LFIFIPEFLILQINKQRNSRKVKPGRGKISFFYSFVVKPNEFFEENKGMKDERNP